MKNKTLGSKLFIIFLAVVGLLSIIACGMFTIKAANYDNSPDDWREIESTFIEYKNFKNIFVKQKQLIIDAYHNQFPILIFFDYFFIFFIYIIVTKRT